MFQYSPIFELTRGDIVECIHYGAVAVVASNGKLVAWFGDPDIVTYLRSSAKPFQAMPFFEHGGQSAYHLTDREMALMCASHSGTDEHLSTVQGIQAKVGISESDLMCGTHPIGHAPTAEAMRQRGEAPTPNRHNCSGKHTGMVAHARLHNLPYNDYINPAHPIQQEILGTFASMCAIDPSQVHIGIDGCSAPNFAVPLRNAARAFACLSDPGQLDAERASVCQTIFRAMTSHPNMVGGPDSFDTHLMQATGGRIVCKGGAEGYQALGIKPGAGGDRSPGLGITIKISDGDSRGSVRPAVTIEILRQLGLITPGEIQALANYAPITPLRNWRKLLVGEARTSFKLNIQ